MKIALRPCFNPSIVKTSLGAEETNSGNCSSSSPNVETEKVHPKKKKKLNKRLLERKGRKFLKLFKKCKTPKTY